MCVGTCCTSQRLLLCLPAPLSFLLNSVLSHCLLSDRAIESASPGEKSALQFPGQHMSHSEQGMNVSFFVAVDGVFVCRSSHTRPANTTGLACALPIVSLFSAPTGTHFGIPCSLRVRAGARCSKVRLL